MVDITVDGEVRSGCCPSRSARTHRRLVWWWNLYICAVLTTALYTRVSAACLSAKKAPHVPGNSSRVPRLRSRGSSSGVAEVEAFRLVGASWWVGGAEAAWLPVWLPRCCWRKGVVLVDAQQSSWSDAKGQDHIPHRDDQITLSFLYLVRRPIPCWLSQACSSSGPL